MEFILHLPIPHFSIFTLFSSASSPPSVSINNDVIPAYCLACLSTLARFLVI